MNKKVLRTVIGLLWLFIIGFCIVKLFFPEELLLVIENEKVLHVGKFIDEHLSVRIIADVFFGLLMYHFYLCACKQCWKLSSWQYFALAAYMIAIEACYLWNPTIGMILDLAALIAFPVLVRAKLGQAIPIFILHQLGQIGLLYIRSEPLYLVNSGYVTNILLVSDAYAWLVLYYLYSNINKERTLWECLVFHFSEISQKMSSKKNSEK